MRDKKLVIGIYYHPEAFPPTLNAVTVLSGSFDTISIIYSPHLEGAWVYPANVKPIASGRLISSSSQENSGTFRKLLFFLRFVIDLMRESIRNRPGVILLYDPHALFAYWLLRPFLFFKHTAWYHNHDIAEISRMRKFSIGWFACKAERKIFRKLDMFSLPSADRLPFFPMNEFKGHYFIIPNYPSLSFYGPFYKPRKPGNEIKLIFQGRIGEGHGFEEIIPMLAGTISGKWLRLILKGYCDPEYQARLLGIAAEHGVSDKLNFAGFTPYIEVPKLASECHIGIGIFSKKEAMHITLGTASNKLYEYAALGLPVIYLNEAHFTKYLQPYNWAFAVQLCKQSIAAAIAAITDSYEQYSESAHRSFTDQLNFENYFKPVMTFLLLEN